MFEVLCFGDSNTFGYSPETKTRLPRDERWPGILREALGSGYSVIEEGLGGRTTVFDDPLEGDRNGKRHLVVCLQSHQPLDLVIIMLGTNDLKRRFSAAAVDVAAGAAGLLDVVRASGAGREGRPPATLLVAPPPFGRLTDFAPTFEGGAEKSALLGKLYAGAARSRGSAFFDSGSVIRSSDLDGIHFERSEHRKLGEAMAKEVRRILAG